MEQLSDLAPYPSLAPKQLAHIAEEVAEAQLDRFECPSEHTFVRLICAPAALGLWGQDGCELPLVYLPVSSDLHRAILIWHTEQERLEDVLFDHQHEPCGTYPPPCAKEYAACAGFGFRVACAIKRALPDWTVVYVDASLQHKEGGVSADYQTYEITLDLALGTKTRPQPNAL